MVPRSIFCWWSPFTVSPPSNKLSLLNGVGAVQRQHWSITNMSESTYIQGISISLILRISRIHILLTLLRLYHHHHSAIHSRRHIIYRINHITVYRIFSYSPSSCFIIILQAICCSFILSMCPNHHSTLWSTLLADSLSILALLLTCPFLCLCRL